MAELLPDGTRKISLGKEQFEAISAVLNSFYQQTKCGVIMLSDVSGLAVALRGTKSKERMALLSTLAAGNYAATGEIAKLLDEANSFSGQFHEGAKQSIYLKGVNDEFFLSVVFGKNQTFGMIRVLVDRVIDQLAKILSEMPSGQSAVVESTDQNQKIRQELEDESFQDELSSRLDEILKF